MRALAATGVGYAREMQQGFAPPRKDSPVVGALIVLFAVVVFAGVIGAIVWVAIAATAPPRDAGHAFLGKLREGDYAGAWEDASDGYKKRTPKESFEGAIDRALPEASLSTDATFNSTSVGGGKACLFGSLTSPDGSSPIAMRLVEERGGWHVDEVGTRSVADCSDDD
jgi:hypothetical protein